MKKTFRTSLRWSLVFLALVSAFSYLCPEIQKQMDALHPRQSELDMLKGVMILLMVAFHLGYIGYLYPTAKAFVYTFHMPTFLLISGYPLNTSHPTATFGRKMLWIFIPYAIMESGYVAASSVLPVRESVEELSILLLLDKIFIHPLGPYWYLHTFMLCSLTCYATGRLTHWLHPFSTGGALVASALTLYGLSVLGLVNVANALWFLAGTAVHWGGVRLSRVFFPTLWAVVPVAFIALHPEWFNRACVPGILLTISILSMLTAVWERFPSRKATGMFTYLGRNTLVIFLFSPVFTMAMKQLLPLFRADTTGLTYLFCATGVATAGSLGIGWLSDRFGLSRYIFGRPAVMHK